MSAHTVHGKTQGIIKGLRSTDLSVVLQHFKGFVDIDANYKNIYAYIESRPPFGKHGLEWSHQAVLVSHEHYLD